MLNKDINDMNDTYAMLPPEEEGVPLQVGYALPRRARRRKACASVLCLMLGMTVVLTFFLIPRDPDIRYVEGKSSFNNETKVIHQTFRFQNHNYYHMNWENLHTEIQLCTPDPSNWYSEVCDVSNPLAIYDYPDSFETKALNSIDLDLQFKTTNATASQIIKIATLCLPQNQDKLLAFRTIMTVDSSLSNGHKFPNKKFSQLILVGCS
tara:strand:+ start:121 stop:744 length:624 start_codon:yes stop_codon:yes gene_type:complete